MTTVKQGDRVRLLTDKVFITGGKSKGKARIIAPFGSVATVIALHDDVAILETTERFSMRLEFLTKID